MLARGPSPLLDLIGQSVEVRKVAVGIYLHEYLITTRYIEAIHAFLQNNLRADLRATGTRYLLEEIGHEVHELAACRELGVQDHEIARFAPLPFFAAYPEVLGAVGELDPLAFCLAVSVAEGLPGTSKPIAAALANRGVVENSLAAHQAIDERLDHTLMTRRLMQHIPWVETRFGTTRHSAISAYCRIEPAVLAAARRLRAGADIPGGPGRLWYVGRRRFDHVFCNLEGVESEVDRERRLRLVSHRLASAIVDRHVRL